MLKQTAIGNSNPDCSESWATEFTDDGRYLLINDHTREPIIDLGDPQDLEVRDILILVAAPTMRNALWRLLNALGGAEDFPRAVEFARDALLTAGVLPPDFQLRTLTTRGDPRLTQEVTHELNPIR